MANIVIEDLAEDAELDALAMREVTGGKRLGGSSGTSLLRHYPSKAPIEESKLVRGLLKTSDLRSD